MKIEKPAGQGLVKTEKPASRGRPRPNIIEQAEAEFGEPMLAILRGLAAQGCSRREAAGVVGYATEGAMRALIARRGWAIEWASTSDICRRVALAAHADGLILTPDVRARLGAATKARMRQWSHEGRAMALTDWMREAGQTLDTRNVSRVCQRVKQRTSRGWPFWDALTTPPSGSRS